MWDWLDALVFRPDWRLWLLLSLGFGLLGFGVAGYQAYAMGVGVTQSVIANGLPAFLYNLAFLGVPGALIVAMRKWLSRPRRPQ